jgi:hypothetical protein
MLVPSQICRVRHNFIRRWLHDHRRLLPRVLVGAFDDKIRLLNWLLANSVVET